MNLVRKPSAPFFSTPHTDRLGLCRLVEKTSLCFCVGTKFALARPDSPKNGRALDMKRVGRNVCTMNSSFGVRRRKVPSFEEPVKKLGDKRGFVDL